jgi:hypothetical protein
MNTQGIGRFATVLAVGTGLLLAAGPLCADSVKLNGGGSLNGSVTTGSKAVSVRTSSGAVVVFDRAVVKQVTHGRTSSAKTASNSSIANAHSKKPRLTPEEEAWMPKVRGLASRLCGGDRARSQQARTALLKIDETDSIPALSTHLGNSRNEESRRLYAVILHNMNGPKPVYSLVALSLYDPSPEIRSEARKAIHANQLDSARLLYIAALRSGSPALARTAAVGLGEIGDPRGDSVPYLINALVSYGTISTLRAPAQSSLLYTNAIYATPGLKLNDFNPTDLGTAVNTATTPVSPGPGATPNEESGAAAQATTSPGQQTPGTSPVNNPWQFGQAAQNSMANSAGTSNLQMTTASAADPGTPTEAELYESPTHKKCGKQHDRPLSGYIDHPEVLDVLLKITDQPHPGFGFNRDRWRSWWANEKTNRDLQKPAVSDRIVSSSSASH